MTKVTSLLALMSFTRDVEAEFVAELLPAECQASGASDDWAAKDVVAHVATWRERGAAEIAAAREGKLDPEPQEFDEANRLIFEENRGRSWDAVLRLAEASWDAFARNLADLPEDLLASSAAGQPNRPLWRRITVDAGNHPAQHYAEFARRHGRTLSATRWMEGLTPLLLKVDPSAEWHGVVHYNLACHYALSGEKDRALSSLKAGLALNPSLREWSRQDSDLAPLHGDPRFAPIVGSES